MFYRRKVILAILEALGGELTPTDLQKHLFLFTRSQETPAYDFVPHRYGCYSFSLEADREPMIRAGLLGDRETWRKTDRRSYAVELDAKDQERLREYVRVYGSLRGQELARLVFTQHPYYAIRSEIAEDVLGPEALERVRAMRPGVEETALFTIGYEGRSLEAYLNRLIGHDVRVLCDVRMNPISRKYGFSKRQLGSAVEDLGMHYVHIPALGIASEKRKALASRAAYEQLFEAYERETLSRRGDELDQIVYLFETHERVALTCFEACHTDCHRSRVATALMKRPGWDYRVLHI